MMKGVEILTEKRWSADWDSRIMDLHSANKKNDDSHVQPVMWYISLSNTRHYSYICMRGTKQSPDRP